MATVFKVWPKVTKKSNGLVLTPEMEVLVTINRSTSTPFANGAPELIEAYKKMYGYDYKKGCCHPNDFEFKKIS